MSGCYRFSVRMPPELPSGYSGIRSYKRGLESLKENPKELVKLERRIKNTKDFLEYYNPEIKVKEN